MALRLTSRALSTATTPRLIAALRASGGALTTRGSLRAAAPARWYSAAWDGSSMGDPPGTPEASRATSAPDSYVQRPTKGDVDEIASKMKSKARCHAGGLDASGKLPGPNSRNTTGHNSGATIVRRYHDRGAAEDARQQDPDLHGALPPPQPSSQADANFSRHALHLIPILKEECTRVETRGRHKSTLRHLLTALALSNRLLPTISLQPCTSTLQVRKKMLKNRQKLPKGLEKPGCSHSFSPRETPDPKEVPRPWTTAFVSD